MLKLFAVKHVSSNDVVRTFDNKMDAKVSRNKLNEDSMKYCVTRGVDHRLYGIKYTPSIHPKCKSGSKKIWK